MIGSEDLALAKHSILMITSGDLGTVFSKVKLHPSLCHLQENQYLDHDQSKGGCPRLRILIILDTIIITTTMLMIIFQMVIITTMIMIIFKMIITTMITTIINMMNMG